MVKIVGKVSVDYTNNGNASEITIRKNGDFVMAWGMTNDKAIEKIEDKIKFFNYTKGINSHYSKALRLVLSELS